MPQEERSPEEPPMEDPWRPKPAAKEAANPSWKSQGQCYNGTGFWDKGRGEWKGMQPPGTTDPEKWQNRQGQ
eukprot:1421448-Heterocapsa_arctica.AAC.1